MDSKRLAFKEALITVPINSHLYEMAVPLDFCFGNTAHGGFLVSMIAHAAQQHFGTTRKEYNQPHPFNIHVMFLRTVTAGKVELAVKDSSLGTGISTIHVTLSQGGKERVAAYVSNTNMHAKHGVSYDTDYQLNPAPSPADVPNLGSGLASGWIEWLFPYRAKSLVKPYTHFRFYIPTDGPPDPSLTDVWIAPESTNDVFTTESLGFIADVWPRMVENYCPESEWSTNSLVSQALRGIQNSTIDTDFGLGRHPLAFWYPTLSLTLEIKKLLPPQGVKKLFVRAQAKEIKNGRMDVEVMILDEASDLVALSHHVCLLIKNADGPLEGKKHTDAKL